MIDRIRAATSVEIEQRMSQRPLSTIKSLCAPTTRSLTKVLRKSRSAVILECKKASPSQGLIRANFDMAEIVKAYDPFADAISVITNATFFEGDLGNLKKARVHTEKPLLCKDFILSPYQVYEARVYDADAVLLMMSLLDDDNFRACFEVAKTLNMDALVEVHDEDELARALRLGAQIIGVNNRDFRTLKVDMTTAERVLPRIPQDKISVFESGISTHSQLLGYRTIANSFLVGTSLMKQADLPRAVRELVFGRVKVCGLTRNEDALMAHRYGATFGGLIFAPESPRCVSIEQARSVKQNCDLNFVGVFVNQSVSLVADHAKRLHLKAVQLHGEEGAEYIKELRDKLHANTEIWKAVRVQDTIPSPEQFGCDRILLDAYSKDKRGGTGQRFDWNVLSGVPDRQKYILSGGLSPENAREADAQSVWALDVNSCVEISPGVKDEERVRAFCEELR
jgi:indole-3-glycerol phosphate synthase/phosphoribosylanthranilate isomerase